MSERWIKAHYLDASALVKLVVDEKDSEPVRAFFQINTNFYATTLCLSEALGVLKGKWSRKEITDRAYFAAARTLVMQASAGRISLDSIKFLDRMNFAEVEAMAKKHQLDLSDALQLVTILKGTFSRFGPGSASVLITADKRLAAAAEAENIRSWDCTAGPAPAWP